MKKLVCIAIALLGILSLDANAQTSSIRGKLIDTIGGVIVDVDRPVKDDAYPTDDYGFKRIYYAPGPQLLDGRLLPPRPPRKRSRSGRA